MADSVNRKRLLWQIHEWFDMPLEPYSHGHYGPFMLTLQELEQDALQHIHNIIRKRIMSGPDPANRRVYISNYLKPKSKS